MRQHDYTLVNADTDSISFCKKDSSPFTEEETEALLNEVNSLFPERINFENDGVFKKVIVIKAKNYVLWDGKKMKTKGSALKASTKEPALRELIDRIINEMLNDSNNYLQIYHEYVKEALDVKDMKRWASRKSITEAVLNPERTNEQKVADALEGEEFQPGDRRYFYFKSDGSLSLLENFNGDYDKYKLIEKIWKTMQIFSTILDTSILPKYHLKTKRKLLDENEFFRAG